jgi:periplasmic protein TonB
MPHATAWHNKMFAQSPKPEPHRRSFLSIFKQKQPRRLLLAFILLMIALAVVVVKDRSFWFGSEETGGAESAPAEPASMPAKPPSAVVNSVPSTVSQAPSAPATPPKKQITAKASAEKSSTQKSSTEPAAANPGVVATNRTVLPPLSVEVVAGDTHRTLHPGSNAIKIEIPGSKPGAPNSTTVTASIASGPTTNAAELERLSPGIATTIDQAGNAYPLLAQRARVEGSVVLEALIGADGVIQNLRVLSGPSILAPAAQQAVRQWRFKPYLQNGQPVETRANITVIFIIKVSDSSKVS